MFFFNNCKNRSHPSIYRIPDAFYDLELTGFNGDKATTFSPGETCIVATTMKDWQVRFTRYRLEHIEIRRNKEESLRVFCGPALQTEMLSKEDAARDGQYSIFFNRKGHFKRRSVLQQ